MRRWDWRAKPLDSEKLIEQLRKSADFEDYPIVASFAAIIEKKYLRDAATALSTLKAENEKLRADLERLGLELKVRKRQEEAMTDIANDFQRQLHAALDQLEQVKHQRDSYRLYHDDLASKPNCNTCADKDCKYRPIPGDTVRANCPLWRGAGEG